jgi:DNA polymerase elongation subunit (family B)
MISQNLSHDSKVWTKEYNLNGEQINETGEKDKDGKFIYDNLPGYEYIDLEFDTYRYIRKTPTSRAEKTKCGKMICRWAQFPDNRKGIMPSILEELLKARSDTRKMIKTEKDPFMQNILDKRQLGYKVTANSLYGQCGSRTSTFYEKDVAASTTAVESNSSMNMVSWFMGTKQTTNENITKESNSKKQMMTNGIAPNRLLIKTFLKKASQYASNIA